MKDLPEDPIIHVVIPTGGREETIESTLLSCKNQSYDRMVVWVCDNSSDKRTGEIVNGLSDERFRVIRPKRRLCMAENWEFAISHLDEGYVTIIGDDDCLMPDCLTKISKVIKAYPEIPVINQLPGNYFWPSYPDESLANKLQVRPMNFDIQVKKAKPILANVCTFSEWYGYLPFLYHGFVDVGHIQKIKSETDTPFFNFCAPDVYSDIVLALHTERFIVVNTALTLGGQSARSNGANYASGNSLAKQFINELPEHLKFTYESKSISLLVFNAIEIAMNTFPRQCKDLVIDFDVLLGKAIEEVSHYGNGAIDELCSKLTLIYSQSEIDDAISSFRGTGTDAISKKRPKRSLLRRIASRVRKELTSCLSREITKERLRDTGKDKEDLANIYPGGDRLSWKDGFVTTQQFIDLRFRGVETVYQAAQYLSEQLNALIYERKNIEDNHLAKRGL